MSEQEEDFAAMLEASFKTRRVSQGESVEGTIVSIGRDVALVDIGGKSEAVVEVAELKDADGDIEFNVGDRLQAVVVSTAGGITLSRRLARAAATDRQLENAFHSRLPVEGTVQGVVKGGYEVRIGRSRGFCPFSQIDIVRTENPETHVGRAYTFRITEYKDGGRNLVVSRRALLEEEQKAQAEEVRRTLVPGAVVKGRVVTVRDYGAFVDMGGGIQGLLHVSEMGWSRVADTAQVVAAGEEISVQVLRVDEGTNKIALGLKQLTADPWTTVPERYTVGEVYQGRVTRLAPFGAFIELEPGVEALAHVSTFPPSGRRDAWMAQVPVGATAAFEILTIDLDQKRIGVALVPEGSTRAAGAVTASGALVPGTRLTGKVERHERFGVFVFLGPGRTALMPTSETGVDRDADLARTFPVGSDVEVIVLEVDPAGRRITVSRKAVFDAQEAEELREYAARPDAAPTERLGSLADKLKGAWGKK